MPPDLGQDLLTHVYDVKDGFARNVMKAKCDINFKCGYVKNVSTWYGIMKLIGN
ncbi:MAG: hypothetical protein RIQ88_227 [Actinomycetota bacterium]|jgi:hypothetical protein